MADYDFRKASPATKTLLATSILESIEASGGLSRSLGESLRTVSLVDPEEIFTTYPKLYGRWSVVTKKIRELQESNSKLKSELKDLYKTLS